MKFISKIMTGLLVFLALPSLAFASNASINSGDTAWVLISAALVMMMTPAGLALFYGGMSRSKNVLNTMGMSFVSYGIVSVLWVIFQFSLAFGTDINGIIGNLRYLLMSTNINIVFDSTHVSVLAFAAFQLTFAAITTALISGSIVERVKFSSWVVFSIIWSTIVYTPLAHWVWGGGWLAKMGIADFAGGLVVETNSGIAGLVFALMIGKRKGFRKISMQPSSIALTALGAGLLWFGWFGFNAGSAISSGALASNAFLTTNTAGAMGAISWMIMDWSIHRHPTILGFVSGAVAGLVAITPAAGFVNNTGAIAIGFIAGLISWVATGYLKYKLGYDDSLDVFGVHGLNGIWGMIAIGLFADPKVNFARGLIYGGSHQIVIQLIGVVATIVFVAIGTFISVKATSILTGGLRVDEEDEIKGLDIAIHTEKGFEL
ncbi:ammonium transporter [Hippea maritima]|uniref:Ammonium transporter n=1 Tax=Hippea maritima (strain ATCC 700847 / DSM 10411 / MH2) TaxID=760142 RepID=F2LU00_HIPMA|nr:ammonium transporter [Hippea maritima]AEA33399.1 ammonium transporter [Hippea maritima DSM 10411]